MINGTTIAQLASPRFNSGIQVFAFPDEPRIITDLAIVPNGEYLITHTQLYEAPLILWNDMISSARHLWQIAPSLNSHVKMTMPDEAQVLDIGETDFYGMPPMSFSGDSRWLAVRLDTTLSVYSFPDMQLKAQIATEPRNELPNIGWGTERIVGFNSPGIPQWSPDSRFIAWIKEQTLFVWEWEKDILRTQALVANFGTVTATQQGWFISYVDIKTLDAQLFEMCPFGSNSCLVYDIGSPIISSITRSDGEIIVTQNYLGGTTSDFPSPQVWVLQSDGNYLIENDIPNMIYPRSISADNQYILGVNQLDGALMIWDRLHQQTALSLASRFIAIDWFDDEHVITIHGETLILSLYKVGQSEPIDTLDINQLLNDENVQDLIYPENFRIRGVTEDGKIIINFGRILIVASVTYQPVNK
jgi:hypothetical protein